MIKPSSRIIGIDLSGSEKKASGWALLETASVSTRTILKTEDIIEATIASRPDLVSIDSPLALPVGRHCSLDNCECRRFGISRSCERELKRRGISVYWCLIRSMQSLTMRGMEIAGRLRQVGINVIESYPGAAQDIMRIPRKRTSLVQLRSGLVSFGLNGIRDLDDITHDELDAATSAIVGTFFLANSFEALGDAAEGHLIVPRLVSSSDPHLSN
jgi:predicted nuclease with RNAse H fold